eukprot:254583_1
MVFLGKDLLGANNLMQVCVHQFGCKIYVVKSFGLGLEKLFDGDDVFMVQEGKHLDFAENALTINEVLEDPGDLLDRDLFIRLRVLGSTHHAVGPVADSLLEYVFVRYHEGGGVHGVAPSSVSQILGFTHLGLVDRRTLGCLCHRSRRGRSERVCGGTSVVTGLGNRLESQ